MRKSVQHPREWLSRLHPEDRPRVKQQIAAHITGKAQHFESEYRILCKDGTYRWALTRGLASVDSNGKAQRIAGSQTDITERKLYEPLTGLPNRILFADRIQNILDRSQPKDKSRFAVLSIRMADFKEVADGLHSDRDELFLQIAQRTRESLRDGDTLAHFGEETLGVLLEAIGSQRSKCCCGEGAGSVQSSIPRRCPTGLFPIVHRNGIQ